MKELHTIQEGLVAPKNQYNKFGKYNYRSCEDILEAVKPLLKQTGCTLTLEDDIVMVGNRIYVKAIVLLKNEKGEVEKSQAFALEDEAGRNGMTGAQNTGASSSYARKYALSGLFAIDDNKDADATNKHGQGSPATMETKSAKEGVKACNYKTLPDAIAELNACGTIEDLQKAWSANKEWQTTQEFIDAKNECKGRLTR